MGVTKPCVRCGYPERTSHGDLTHPVYWPVDGPLPSKAEIHCPAFVPLAPPWMRALNAILDRLTRH